MRTNSQNLANAGVQFLTEGANLLRALANLAATDRVPEETGPTVRRSKTVLRLRPSDSDVATNALRQSISALKKLSNFSLDLATAMDEKGKIIQAQIASTPADANFSNVSNIELDMDCCDIDDFQYDIQQRGMRLMAAYADFHNQSSLYFQSFECIHVFEPHPIIPDLEDSDAGSVEFVQSQQVSSGSDATSDPERGSGRDVSARRQARSGGKRDKASGNK